MFKRSVTQCCCPVCSKLYMRLFVPCYLRLVSSKVRVRLYRCLVCWKVRVHLYLCLVRSKVRVHLYRCLVCSEVRVYLYLSLVFSEVRVHLYRCLVCSEVCVHLYVCLMCWGRYTRSRRRAGGPTSARRPWRRDRKRRYRQERCRLWRKTLSATAPEFAGEKADAGNKSGKSKSIAIWFKKNYGPQRFERENAFSITTQRNTATHV